MGAAGAGGPTGSEVLSSLRRLLRRASRSYLVVVLVGLVLGLAVAPVASDFVENPSEGTVAVVPLSGAIDGPNAQSVVDRLDEARDDPAVDAVVLWINSGGGGASPSESIYLAVGRLAEDLPVVTSVDSMAASGAYYAAAPSDVIYAKPSSLVGSVGVYTTVPRQFDPIEGVIQSGPNKLEGGDRRDWFYKSETVTNAFLNAVEANRGSRLQLSRNQLAYAKLYTGGEAVGNGVADAIGGLQDAIDRAAREAGLANHDVTVLGYEGGVDFLVRSTYVAANASAKRLVDPVTFVGVPTDARAPNVLMLPPSVLGVAADPSDPGTTPNTEVNASGTPTP